MTFLNGVMLFGLMAVAVPLLIHFFSRKKYDEVDWAAMQFLAISTQSRRRRQWDQLLLMLIRCGAIALLVFALAAPSINVASIPLFNRGAPKDVIILIDCSGSMSGSPADSAKAWATRLIGSLRTVDRLAVFAVRRTHVPIVPPWSSDREKARAQLDLLPAAAGSVDWPTAVSSAIPIFDDATRDRHIVIVTDGQKYGLADESALARWPLAAPQESESPHVWIAPLISSRPDADSSITLEPITASRGVAIANRELTFRSAVKSTKNFPPAKVAVEWDGRSAGDVNLAADGTILLKRRFPAGSHLLSLILGNARQDYAFEVIAAIPVLIVDGDARMDGSRTLPMQVALAPMKDQSAGFAVKVISSAAFGPVTVTQDVAGPDTPPRAVILANVTKLTTEQNRAIERYLQDGGTVLMAPGDRCEATSWNSIAWKGSQSWLPARMDRIVEEANAHPLPQASSHLAMSTFREALPGGLHAASISKYWKLDPSVGGPNVASVCGLSTGDPFLIARGFGRGMAMMACIPFDRSWPTDLPTLPDYVRLMHELLYTLVGVKSMDRNLTAGSAIVFTPDPRESPAAVTVQAPEIAPHLISPTSWPLIYHETTLPGIYRMTTAAGRTTFFAVRGDPKELDLTPISEADRTAIMSAQPSVTFIADPSEIDSGRSSHHRSTVTAREIWWIAMLGVLVLFAVELMYVRKVAG